MYSDKIALDKFYTKSEVVQLCLTSVANFIHCEKVCFDIIIDPSAGNGAFSSKIKEEVPVIALDIEPDNTTNTTIVKADWLTFSPNKAYNNLLVIGNPPFGKRNKMSRAFIKKAIELNAHTIAFILPDVYNKFTLQSVFPEDYKLYDVVKLPNNSFLIEDKDYHVPCSFFIWTKSSSRDLRFDCSLYQTSDWEFVRKSQATENDFFIFGASPNTIIEINNVASTNRGYYIRPVLINKDELIKRFKIINFNGFSGVNGGVSWRTKVEIVKNYIDNY